MGRRTPIALIPLLLLPNFLFLIPLAPVTVSSPNPPPGQPLPPGTVTYRNTWNMTQTCPKVTSAPEPLVAQANGWSTTLRIPTQLFMGSPQGSYIIQSFALSKNGTFTVSDDHGNSYSLTIPTANSGTSVSDTLIGNSTAAIQETTASTGPFVSSDVKLRFSVNKQSCQPAGIRLEIIGTENWGPSGRGKVDIHFDRKSLALSAYRAWFSNNSGIALGFDWFDSKNLVPVFDSATSSLEYSVSASFTIDPITITTLPYSSTYGSFMGRDRNSFFSQGRWWVFFVDSSSNLAFVTTKDLATFSASTAIRQVNQGQYYRSGISIWYDGTYFSYTAFYNNAIYYREGSPKPDGTVTWRAAEQTVASGLSCSGGSFCGIENHVKDTNGHPWLLYMGGSSLYVATSSNTDGTWVSPSGYPMLFELGGASGQGGEIVPLTNGKMALFEECDDSLNCGSNTNYLTSWTYDGTNWSGGTAHPSHKGGGWDQFSAVQNTGADSAALVFICYSLGGTGSCTTGAVRQMQFVTWSYGSGNGGSWGSDTNIVGSANICQSSDLQVAITTDSTGRYWATWFSSTTSISFITGTGSSWSAITNLESGATMITTSLAASWNPANGFLLTDYFTGSAAPYNLRFSAYPTVIPTAAVSPNSWSRPGLSPYESYFSHFSDYVSPGNGLVSVEVGTLELPGRGLELASSLVFSTPYAFRSSGSPYLYDNYTGASLGYGWSLNFPWFGANYFHLSDGQAFPYSWNGNTFQINGVTSFVLTKNTGGTYTLNMSSGTLYRFDTSQRLISITDRTGNNRISFSYGTNGYISQVTDTISRAVTFSYNGNNQLTSITQGGRTWSLGYAGSQLSTLTDPITSRVTTFHYVGTSGANLWLIREVIWPTAGKVNYTYSSALVGTEVSTYYATSRNVWYDSSHLSQSQSISPYLVNGQMVWSNSTIADGSRAIQSYLRYNFQNSKNLMKAYSYDGTGTLQLVTETDSDLAGRTNATKIYAPSGGTPLAQSTYSYDNWGNMIYSKDNVGQQTWYSYANATPTNSFGTSGCSASFYTQPSMPNIHNLLVGTCDYQNGSGTPQQQTYDKYDTSGNLLETKILHPSSGWLYTDYTYDSYGNVITMKNSKGFYTNSTYSNTYSSAYLTKQNSTISRSPYKFTATTWTWNSTLGEKASVTDPRGYTTSYKYDNIGRLKLVAYGGTSYTRSYLYDDTNNIVTITDENGHVTKNYFDGLARETKIERWNGSSVYSTEAFTYNWVDAVATMTTATGSIYSYSYDWNGRLTKLTNPDSPATYETTSYDDVNNLKTFTDERGHQTVYTYNWNNWLTSVKQYNSSTNYYYTVYSYDKSGNLLSVTDAHIPGQVTSYQYDNLNRLNQTTFPDGKTEKRTYDGVGNLLTRTTANGSQISYTYDGLNRLTKVTYQGSGGTVYYTYDQMGNRVKMVSPSATDIYTYSNDALSRLTNQTEYVGGVKYQTLFSYDGVGNVLTLTYPDGYALTMTYDGVNRLKKVGGYATVGYTFDDKISKITYGDGEVATYTYDSRDRPTRIVDKSGSTKELDLNYTYDGTGNVKTINTNAETYKYDWLNRLNYSSGPWTTTNYAYDQAGNRIRMVQRSTTTVYCYGSFNRLSSYTTSTCSSPTVSYTYDANGNTITKTGGWTYSYDYENRLTKVVQSSTTLQQNYYDGDGNRVKQVAGSSTFTYSYQGLNIFYEKNVTGSTTTVTKHFYANGLQVAKMVGTGLYYLHQDALGSTRLVATAAVTIKFSSNYVPYGSNYGISGKEVFMYTGKPYDSATGLYYEGARYYDPTTGRFTIQDSITGTQEDPMSLNRYIYARDNPMKIVDLAGHEWWNPVADLTSAASSVVGAVSTGISDVAGAVTNTWNSLPPQDQAIVVTVGVDVAAGIAVAADAASLCATCSLTAPLVGAAISTTIYTATAGSSATAAGAVGAAVTGAASVGLGGLFSGALGGVIGSGFGSVMGSGAAAVAADFAGTGATALLGGRPRAPTPDQLALSFGLGVLTPSGLGDEVAVKLGFSSRSASSLDDYVNPYDARTAAGWAISQTVTWGANIGTTIFGKFAGNAF